MEEAPYRRICGVWMGRCHTLPVRHCFTRLLKPPVMAQEQRKGKDELLKKMILRFPKEHKIKLLNDAIQEGNIAAYFQLTKILLDASISEGGISSDEIPHPVEILNHDKEKQQG